MREKLLELLNREGLRPSQLAEMLEINPAGISHILAGRNKPSFELLQKILRRFPQLNPDWLLLDSDQMYRSDIPFDNSQTNSPANSNRESSSRPAGKDQGLFASLEKNAAPGSTSQNGTSNVSSSETRGASNDHAAGSRKAAVQRIVIFYDDQTFEVYTPNSK